MACVMVLAFTECKQSDPVEKTMQLVWSDEFEGNELDLNNWEIQTGNGQQYGLWNWGNNEEQWYQADNVTVSNGRLLIKAIQETIGNYEYTSGRIRSLNKADFKYGRIEASIKMAATAGLWHAFWMLPSSEDASWPTTGEIDIMEYVGNKPNELFTTIHLADQFGNHRIVGEQAPFTPTGFHIYAVEWDENAIRWFIDEVEVYNVDRNEPNVSATWPFDAEFHMLLNTAVGGNLGGNVDAQALSLPKFMEVEYVRVYQEVE